MDEVELQHTEPAPGASGLLPKDSTFRFCFEHLDPLIKGRALAAYQLLRLADDTTDRGSDQDRRLDDLLTIQRAYRRVPGYRLPVPSILEALEGDLERIAPELDRVIEGMRWDLERRSYATVDELLQYCDRVSYRATRVFVHLFGDDPDDWQDFVYATGMALQLTNILRDIEPDASQGRVYLPAEWRAGEPEEASWRRLANLAYAYNLEAGRLYPEKPTAAMLFVESCRRSYAHLLDGVWMARETGVQVPRRVPPPILEKIPYLVAQMAAKGRSTPCPGLRTSLAAAG